MTLVVENPCRTSTIQPTSAGVECEFLDITYSLLAAAPSTTTNLRCKDSASTTYGNNDGFTLCGAREYTFTNWDAAWGTRSGTENTDLSVTSSDGSLVGQTITVDVDVKLVDYDADVTHLNYQFNVIFTPCQVSTVTKAANDLSGTTITYTILVDGTITRLLPTYTQDPACGYPAQYSAQ